MSTHTVPAGQAIAVMYGSRQAIRQPETVTSGDPDWTFTFTPDLTAPELVTFNRLVSVARSPIGITPAEWQAIQPDIDGLQTFQGIATPTLVQTVAAVKAQSRILRALLRS